MVAAIGFRPSILKVALNRRRAALMPSPWPFRSQLEESVARYLSQLDTADRQEPTERWPLR